MKQFFSNLWRRRWIRLCAWFAFSAFTILILARQYISWSGARRLAAVEQMLEREGETLDFRKTAPGPIPDAENFCAIPALKDLPLIPEGEEKSERGLRRLKLLKTAWPVTAVSSGRRDESIAGARPMSSGVEQAQRIDLKAWAEWFRKDDSERAPAGSTDAEAILGGLSRNDAVVAELAAGLERPESQWTPAWKARDLPDDIFEITLPHYHVAQSLAQMLCRRGALQARLGDAAKAHEAVRICVRINEANAKEPFLIGALVTASESAMISGAVWEICESRSGTAEDFRKLQEALERLDLRQTALVAMRAELAAGVDAMAYFKRTRDIGLFEIFGNREDPWKPYKNLGLQLLPGGWFDGNAAVLAQWEFESCVKPLRDSGLQAAIAAQDAMEKTLVKHTKEMPWKHLDKAVALLVMPVMGSVASKLTYTQCLLNEGIAACTLERYRIERGEYPESLEAANRPGEKPIPMDVISDQPMHYRRTPNGRYALWCVGFDGKDDDGKRGGDKTRPESTKFGKRDYKGDWVWDYPAD